MAIVRFDVGQILPLNRIFQPTRECVRSTVATSIQSQISVSAETRWPFGLGHNLAFIEHIRQISLISRLLRTSQLTN